MTIFLTTALLSLGVGAAYALLANGIALVFRGSGVLNLAHGAFAMVGAYLFYEIWQINQVPWGLALPIVVLITGLGSGVMYLLLLRPLHAAAPLVRLTATLGVLLVLQSAVVLKWGSTAIVVNTFLPQNTWHLGKSVVVEDRVIALATTVLLTGIIWWVWRFTNLGRATSAIAENRRAGAALGWSPDLIAAVNWAVGGALAGLAGIFIAEFVGTIDPVTTTLLVIAGLAVALIGGFTSFPLILVGGIAVGIAEAEVQQYFPQSGSSQVVPLIIVVAVLVVRGKNLPVRGYISDRLPRVGSGKVSVPVVIAATGVTITLLLTVLPIDLVNAVTAWAVGALVLLSVVVLTGYAGQLSLAQYAIAGMGALFAGRLVASAGWGFVPALLVGVIGAAAVGIIFGLPALRARGTTLAVITLTFGVTVQAVIFTSPSLTGGDSGVNVPPPTIFGLQIDAINHPQRYAVVSVVAFVLCALSITRLRRSRAGRRLIAVRANERAAAAMGVSVFESKLYAFTVSSAIAALAGILIAFQRTTILYEDFDPLSSIYAVAYAVIGGLGFVMGPVIGGTLLAGSIGAYVTSQMFPSLTAYIALIGGLLLLVTLIMAQDGLVWLNIELINRLRHRFRPQTATSHERPTIGRAEPGVAAAPESVVSRSLEVRGISVAFGGVRAVSDLSFSVAPGEVVGLIGPNGAGKTTVIDAVTGFVKMSSGEVFLGGDSLRGMSAYRRARSGISRSFQSMELLDDVSVEENLRIASDRRDRLDWVYGLVYSKREPLSGAAEASVRQFELEHCLSALPPSLSQAERRLVSIARAVASQPSILMLDEPAAALHETESRHLAALIRSLATERNMGVLVIEHDVAFVMQISDRVLVLDNGELLAEGPPAEIRDNPRVISAYLGEPAPNEGGSTPPFAGELEAVIPSADLGSGDR